MCQALRLVLKSLKMEKKRIFIYRVYENFYVCKTYVCVCVCKEDTLGFNFLLMLLEVLSKEKL